MTWTLVFLPCLLTIPLCFLAQRAARQARTRALLTIRTPRGLVEERYVPIGGIDQWIGIRGEDTANPVLLVLHGGPGCSYSIFTPHLRTCEKHFTIVQWDQRGSGRTFARTRRSDPLTFDQLVCDAAEVATYARTRLGKERIFLLASSIGSTFGIRLVHRRPDLFYAYIGTDQNVGMQRDQAHEHEKMLERLRALGLRKELKAAERIGPDPARWSPRDFEAIARCTMRSDAHGYARTMKLLKDAVWYAPCWSLKDIRSFVAGMHHSLRKLLPEIVRYDAWQEGLRFEIPFFIFQGEVDALTTPALAREYFDNVVAPIKRFALIPDAGHFAAFLQPEEFLRQLLAHVRPLSQPATDVVRAIISR